MTINEQSLRQSRLPLRRTLRDDRRGFVLLTTLLMLLTIASVLALVQARVQATQTTFARLDRAEAEAMAEISVRARLRLILAEALTASEPGEIKVPLDGTAFEMTSDGRQVEVRLNDVGGLVDLYFAPPALLEALPGGEGMAAGRQVSLIGLAHGARFWTEEAGLARFGAEGPARQLLRRLVTQSGRSWMLNAKTVPQEMRAAIESLGLAGVVPIRAAIVKLGEK